MVRFSLWASLQAKPGKEAEVEKFLTSALELAKKETGTVTWYAIKMGNGHFGIFDTFESAEAQEAHLGGEIAKQLMARAEELLATPLSIDKPTLLAAKIPGHS